MTRPVPPPGQRPPVPEIQAVGSSSELHVRGVRVGAALVGGVTVVVSAFLTWLAGGTESTAFDLPLRFLVDVHKVQGGLKLGLLVLAIGAVGVAAGLRALPGAAGRVAGVAALVVPTLFLVQLQRAVGAPESGRSVLSLGVGAWVCAGGGLLLLLGGRARRRP